MQKKIKFCNKIAAIMSPCPAYLIPVIVVCILLSDYMTRNQAVFLSIRKVIQFDSCLCKAPYHSNAKSYIDLDQ